MVRLTQSYAHGASAVPLIGETIGVYFDEAAERFGDRDALIVRHQDIRWTYAELKQRVDAFAAGLVALGLTPGERIGIWSPNNSEWVVTQFATAKAGLILVNINPAYRLSELEYALNKVGCRALITAASFKSSDYIAMLRELAPEIDRSAPGRLDAQPSSRAQDPDPHRRRRDARRSCASTTCSAWAATGTATRSPIWPAGCSSTIRSTSSSPPARPGCRRARRSRTTTS